MLFRIRVLRLRFLARGTVTFPAGMASNILRGAMGKRLKQLPGAYEQVFEPRSGGIGPSGFADQPRPFVIRASHLDNARIERGGGFHFDLHLFDLDESVAAGLVGVFAAIAEDGFGPAGGSASLQPGELPPAVEVELFPPHRAPQGVRVNFETPTEIKGAPVREAPPFWMLIARLRDRVSNLRALYGEGPLDIDFREVARRAETIGLARADVREVEAERYTRRSEQVHSLGGIVGHADYVGDAGPFLGLLEAGYWTGVGRQTVWGKGQIRAVHEKMLE